MNYITEISAFFKRQETNPLSPHAACLWYALMQINSHTGWKPAFSVSTLTLMEIANLSKESFNRAGAELTGKEYIRYQPRGINHDSIYQIITEEENRRLDTELKRLIAEYHCE